MRTERNKPMEKRIVIGMSGGVDSSVAAALLLREGYKVIGLSMELYSCDRPLGKGCCTPADRLDARTVCEQLKIPYDMVDLRPQFRETVVHYFAEEYSRGRTPLPCAPCNSEVRFRALLDYAEQAGAGWIATGHYARVRENDDGSFSLLRGVDLKKDQSYFLWGLGQKELSRLKFPIGNFKKEEVRRMAREFGLATHSKRESQELCFVGDDDHAHFLEEHFPERAFPAGDFVDGEGHKLGRHHGVHAYTVGQRKGLGVSFGERRYVVRLDAEKNEIVLGERDELKAQGLIAKNIHWNVSESRIKVEEDLMVKIRSTHPGVGATLETCEEYLKVSFEKPQEAVAPGQAAVFYRGDVCLGGGWIERGLA